MTGRDFPFALLAAGAAVTWLLSRPHAAHAAPPAPVSAACASLPAADMTVDEGFLLLIRR
jgi:hypothetical protein